MAGQLQFNRDYAAFGAQVRDFEKSDDVGYVVSEFLWYDGYPFYPVGALIEAQINAVWLGAGEAPDTSKIDLIFRMRSFEDPDAGPFFFEIVLRDGDFSIYGGYAIGSALSVTDEIVNGHRVLESEFHGESLRYTFDPAAGQYRETGDPTRMSTSAMRRFGKKRRY